MIKVVLYLLCSVLWAMMSGMDLGQLIFSDEKDKKSNVVQFIINLLLSIAYAGIVLLTVKRLIK